MSVVSVVVPVYKNQAHVKQCIESLIAQTYTNIEILLIDDGSPDGCGDLCDGYALINSKIRVFHQENQGASCARNTGIENAIGEWIIFVDSDDWVEPDMVEHMISAVADNEANMCFCGHFEETARRTKTINCEYILQKEKRFVSLSEKVMFSKYYKMYCTPWAKMYRMSIIVDNNIRYESQIGRCEDLLFNLHMFQFVSKYAYCKNALYHYRLHEASKNRTFRSDEIEDMKKRISAVSNFIA